MKPNLFRSPRNIPTMWGAPVTHYRVDTPGGREFYLTANDFGHIGTVFIKHTVPPRNEFCASLGNGVAGVYHIS